MDQRPQLVGYARVSSDEQARSGLGLEDQERAIRAAAGRTWDLVEVVRDEGRSGKDLDRPVLRDLLDRVACGEVDGLVVAKLDRLSRSVGDVVRLGEWADRAGAQLVLLDIDVDTTKPTGRLFLHVAAALSEWERGVIGERTAAALDVRKGQGRPYGRPTVAGVLPDVAARIAAERAAGSSWQAIADGLSRDEVPTVRGGSIWRVSSVQSAGGYRRPPAPRKVIALPEVTRRRARSSA